MADDQPSSMRTGSPAIRSSPGRWRHHPGWRPSQGFPFTREQDSKKEAAKWPDDWNDAASLHDGYGVAILRDRQSRRQRALWMMYGQKRGHSQDNIMDIGLQGHQGILLAHMGYPRNWGYWEYSWSSHNVARQFPVPLDDRPGATLRRRRARPGVRGSGAPTSSASTRRGLELRPTTGSGGSWPWWTSRPSSSTASTSTASPAGRTTGGPSTARRATSRPTASN